MNCPLLYVAVYGTTSIKVNFYAPTSNHYNRIDFKVV